MDSASHSSFDGPRLLREQADLLAQSTPADINYFQFLRLKLNAQQKATAQRNQFQRGTSPFPRDTIPEEQSVTRNSASGPPSVYDVAPSAAFHNSRRDTGADESVMDSTDTPAAASRQAWESPSQPPPPAHDPAPAANSLEDLPALAAKRRTMEDSQPLTTSGLAPTAYDEKPAVAASRSGGMPDVPEHPTESVRMEECPYCGRTFAQGRLEKHADMCRRQQEREQELHKRKPTNRTSATRGNAAEGSANHTAPTPGLDSSKGGSPHQGAGSAAPPKRHSAARSKPSAKEKAKSPAEGPSQHR